jgi:hypothetical protein
MLKTVEELKVEEKQLKGRQLVIITFPYSVGVNQVNEIAEDLKPKLEGNCILLAVYGDVKEQEVRVSELLTYEQVNEIIDKVNRKA